MKPLLFFLVVFGILAFSHIVTYKWAESATNARHQIALNEVNERYELLEKTQQAQIDSVQLNWQKQVLRQARSNSEKDEKIDALINDASYMFWVYNISASDTGLPLNPYTLDITPETSCPAIVRDTLEREIAAKHHLTACITALETVPCLE